MTLGLNGVFNCALCFVLLLGPKIYFFNLKYTFKNSAADSSGMV